MSQLICQNLSAGYDGENCVKKTSVLRFLQAIIFAS